MSLNATFNLSASTADYRKPPPKRAAPFSIRLSEGERARLDVEAAGAPLGAFIKAKVLGDGVVRLPIRMRRTGLAIEDRKAFSQALGLLGKSRLANNLNQLTRLANTGSLPLTPEVEEELVAAFREVREMRRLLMSALGLKPERA